MPIVHITKTINTPKRNIKQTQQIENSLSSFKKKVRCQCLENIILNLLLGFSYFLIDKFWNVFRDETLIKRLSICKNVDE